MCAALKVQGQIQRGDDNTLDRPRLGPRGVGDATRFGDLSSEGSLIGQARPTRVAHKLQVKVPHEQRRHAQPEG